MEIFQHNSPNADLMLREFRQHGHGMSASVRDRWRASAALVKRRAARPVTDQVHWTALRAKVQHTLCDIDALLPITMLPALAVEKVDASMEVYTEHNLQCLRHTAIDDVLNLYGLSVPDRFTSQGFPLA
jgi:hypothetical protein